MFFDIFKKIFKHKKSKISICEHTHSDVDSFIISFKDIELNGLRSELISCPNYQINEYIQDITIYIKDKCTNEDFEWFCQEIRKEYKNNDKK